MKKFVFAVMATLLFFACDNDDERIVNSGESSTDKVEVVEFTTFQINYNFSASEDFREFYHFLIAYMDVVGQQHIDTLNGTEWHYTTPPFPLDEAPDKFVCVVRAERKQADVPELTKYAYTLSYEQNVTVTLANSDGSKIRTFDGEPMNSWSWQASPTALRETLVKYSNIPCVDFVLEKSAFLDLE